MNSDNNYLESSYAGKIVIVDDNPENLRTLKALLDLQGYETFAAINGKLAIEAVKSVLPDLILLDIMMPEMNGYDVCKILKSDKKTKHIPILFISALDEAMDKVKAFECGGVDYISKPFQTEETLARVKTQISLSHTQNQLKLANIELQEHVSKLETTNKELEAFSYSVSHDLQTPLRGIAGFSEILNDDYADTLDESGKHYLLRIKNSAIHMKNLINDMLQLSKLSCDSFTTEKINLSEMVISILSHLESSDLERKVTTHIADNIMATGDARLTKIALTNLLNNAWKFTSKSNDSYIEFGETNKNDKPVFFVRDNGIGFDMEYADKLFQPFQRLDTSSTYEGTGIGLATVQRVISIHGGRIWAESKLNEGATFYFTLS